MNIQFVNGKDPEGTLNSEPITQALSTSCSDNAGFSMKKITAETFSHKLMLITEENKRQKVEDLKVTFVDQLKTAKVYFGRVSFPDNYLVPGEKGKTWGRLKQINQYNFLKRKIISIEESDSVGLNLSYFEQFKSGNLHVHFILSVPNNSWCANIKNFKCELANLFELPQRNKNLFAQFFDYKELTTESDIKDTIEYLFYKIKKTYENLDLSIFMPIYTSTSVRDKLARGEPFGGEGKISDAADKRPEAYLSGERPENKNI